jgi:hypothetical protein
MENELKITVIGAAWYGDWAKNFHLACRRMGILSDIVYINAFPASMGGNSDTLVSIFEKFKATVRRIVPFLFPFLKKMRKFLSEVTLCMGILVCRQPAKHICVFIWVPGSKWVLRFLRKRNIMLVLWMGESTVRDLSWEPLFDYFNSVFMVCNGIWFDSIREKKNRDRIRLLPLASDETIFSPIPGQMKTTDVVFAGKYLPARAAVLGLLRDFKMKIYGYGWEDGFDQYPWLRDVYCGVAPTPEFNKIYNDAKIAIGTLWLSKEPFTGPTQRIFDVALSGTFQLAEDIHLSRQLFGSSVEYFNTAEELKSKTAYYLEHDAEREAKAQRARTESLKYTYTEAAKKIIASCGIDL